MLFNILVFSMPSSFKHGPCQQRGYMVMILLSIKWYVIPWIATWLVYGAMVFMISMVSKK